MVDKHPSREGVCVCTAPTSPCTREVRGSSPASVGYEKQNKSKQNSCLGAKELIFFQLLFSDFC